MTFWKTWGENIQKHSVWSLRPTESHWVKFSKLFQSLKMLTRHLLQKYLGRVYVVINLKSTKTQKAPKKTSCEDFSKHLQQNHLDAFQNLTLNN